MLLAAPEPRSTLHAEGLPRPGARRPPIAPRASELPACLRGKSSAEILAVPVNDGQATSATAGPVLDGVYLTTDPQLAIASATAPVIVSTTADEFTNQLGSYGGTRLVTSAADYESLTRQLYPPRADEILARYPAADYPSPNDALIALEGDRYFICPSRTAARQLARSGQPLWRAVFSHTFEAGPLRQLRAAHGFDLIFGFRNFRALPASAAELRLADTLSDAWIRFARVGDVAWPRYDAARDNFIALDEPLGSGAGIRAAYCDLWGS